MKNIQLDQVQDINGGATLEEAIRYLQDLNCWEAASALNFGRSGTYECN